MMSTTSTMMETSTDAGAPSVDPIDDDLSQLASASLKISLTKELHRFQNVDYLLPKKLHGLHLYKIDEDKPTLSSTDHQSIMGTSVNNDSGVPGFPDFPDCWSGQEGWAMWKKTDAKTNSEALSRRLVCRYRRRKKLPPRTPVNTNGMRKYLKTRVAKKHWKELPVSRKTERRRKMVERLRFKRNMVDLRKSLASLSCVEAKEKTE